MVVGRSDRQESNTIHRRVTTYLLIVIKNRCLLRKCIANCVPYASATKRELPPVPRRQKMIIQTMSSSTALMRMVMLQSQQSSNK